MNSTRDTGRAVPPSQMGTSEDKASPRKPACGRSTAFFLCRFTGSYKNGRRHGKGLYTFASGATYEGEYVNNAKVCEDLPLRQLTPPPVLLLLPANTTALTGYITRSTAPV